MSSPILSCPVCRGAVTITDDKRYMVHQHNNQRHGGICYGSYMPVFMNSRQKLEAGTLMFIAPKRPEHLMDDVIDEFPMDENEVGQ